jgi:predicted O-methyltransferase YrrM
MSNEAAKFHARPPGIVGTVVPTPVGSMNYNAIRALLEEGNFLTLQTGAEIGVFEASTSTHLLRSFPQLKLICVDPFADYSKNESDKTADKMSACETTARTRLAEFTDRVTIIKDYSVSAAHIVQDQSLDFVFIDAIHTQEAVLQDLTAWYPKIRAGGLIAGHDFSWQGIKEAVEEFIRPLHRAAYHTPPVSDVWFFIK